MKRFLLFALLPLMASPLLAQDDALTNQDRELLLERLREIRETSLNSQKGRFSAAISAFNAARGSGAAAHELYLNCVEKVRFEDEALKARDFREWKKKHKEKTDGEAFRTALQHQLNWLVLTLEAISQPEKQTELAPKCIVAIKGLLGDIKNLDGQQKILSEPVLGSDFAKAFDLDALEAGVWPVAPVEISAIYDTVILPPLRTENTITKLRFAWLERIEQEGLLVQGWTRERDEDRKPAFEKWMAEKMPGLLWQMRVDLFHAGDQKTAAAEMLDHLKKHITHSEAPGWISEFTSLVNGESISEE